MARLGLRVIQYAVPISLPLGMTNPPTTPQLEDEPMVGDVDAPQSAVTTHTFDSTKREKEEETIYPTRIVEVGGDERGTRVELEGTEPYASDFEKFDEDLVDEQSEPVPREAEMTGEYAEVHEPEEKMDLQGSEPEGDLSAVHEQMSDEPRGTRVELEGTEVDAADFENVNEDLTDEQTQPVPKGYTEETEPKEPERDDGGTRVGLQGNEPKVDSSALQEQSSAAVEGTEPSLESMDKQGPDHRAGDTSPPLTSTFFGAFAPPPFVESPLVSRANAQQQQPSLVEDNEPEQTHPSKVHDLSTASSTFKEPMKEPMSGDDHMRPPSPVRPPSPLQHSKDEEHSSSRHGLTIDSHIEPSKRKEDEIPQLDTPMGDTSDVWGVGFSSDEEMTDLDEDDSFEAPGSVPSYLQQNFVKAVYYAIGQ